MKKTIFMQNENAVWLKGNLHCHTIFSDGKFTLDMVKYSYKSHGYDFIAVTDHNSYTDTRNISDEAFIMLQGTEITCFTKSQKQIHINAFWENDCNILSGEKFNPENYEQTSKLLDKLRKQGSYIMLNHPHWSFLTSSDVEISNQYDAVEIYNYSTELLENMGDGTIFWTELLSKGCKLWNGGSDDNHNRFETDSLYCDSFGGYTVVKAEARTPSAVLNALKAGSFYTSTGPKIHDFYVEDNIVYIKCSPCKRIYINGDKRQYQCKLGNYVTEFTAQLKGDETFIRAECMNALGQSAYSNPIYLK